MARSLSGGGTVADIEKLERWPPLIRAPKLLVRYDFSAPFTPLQQQRPPIGDGVQQREAAETTIADRRIEKATVDGERKAVEADLGPVRYLATLLGTSDETAMRWFILTVALLLDPAAVLLLLAANQTLTMSAQPPQAAQERTCRKDRIGPNNGLMRCSKNGRYSTVLSISNSIVAGILSPSAFAVVRLIVNSNLLGCWIDKSAGLAPLRILATY